MAGWNYPSLTEFSLEIISKVNKYSDGGSNEVTGANLAK